MLNKLKNIDWTRAMFLVPILLVAGISISHVISWYDLANPYSWALYLSVAIEIGAMTSLIAATKKIKGGVWFMFGLVTFIQVVGNIFYCYANIDETDTFFQKWIELTSPIFETMGTDADDIIPHKRWLALLEGGLLPLISLTSLHFYTKYERDDDDTPNHNNPTTPNHNNPTEKLDLEPTVVKNTTVQKDVENEVVSEGVSEVVNEVVNEEPNLVDEFVVTDEQYNEIMKKLSESNTVIEEVEESIQNPELVEEENPENEITWGDKRDDNYEEEVESLKVDKKELPELVKKTQEKFYPNTKETDLGRKTLKEEEGGKKTLVYNKRERREKNYPYRLKNI